MEIIRLNDSYRGRELVFRYRTEHYYEISTREGENTFFFSLERRPFPTPVEKQFTDKLLEPWKNPGFLPPWIMAGKWAMWS